MKARIALVTLLVVAALAVGVVIGVAAGGGGESKNQPLPPNVVAVSGDATVQNTPDKATVRLGVSVQASTAEDALTQASEKANAVQKSLETSGVESKDIQTTELSVNRYTENRGTPKETTGYRARQEFTVTIRDIAKVGPIVDAAVQAGANDVGGIEFGLSDTATTKNDALQKAVDNARAKAEVLAKAADAALGPVVRIDETGYDMQNYYVRNQALAGFGSIPGPSPSTAVAPGQVETSVTVRVTFELER